MTDHAFLNLQRQLDEAAAHETIQLNQVGEYKGPLVITKPLTLSGRGTLTPIWAYDVPAIWIASKNVVLNNIWATITEDTRSNPISYIAGCEPTYIEMQQKGAAVSNIIDLGVLTAGQSIELPFELDNDFPFDHFDALPSFIQPGAVRHNRYKRRVFWLKFEPPQEDGYILYNLRLKNTQGQSADYLIKAFVNHSSLPPTPNIWVLKATVNGKADRKIFFPQLLELTSRQMRIITGQDEVHGQRYFNIFADSSNRQFIWVPFRDGASVRYGDEHLASWSKRDVKLNKPIRVDGVDVRLEFQEEKKISMKLYPPGLGFGNVSSFNVQQEIQLTFNQRWKLNLSKREFTVEALVPWLEVASRQITVDRNGGTVKVKLTQQVSTLEAGKEYVEPSAIAIYDDTEIYFLPAQIVSALPPYDYALESRIITFVPADGNAIYAGEIGRLQSAFQIDNIGTKPNRITVITKPDWVDVSREIDNEIDPGDTLAVGLRLNDQANRALSHGHHDFNNCIVLEDTQGKKLSLDISLDIAQERFPTVRIENKTSAQPIEFNLDIFRHQNDPKVNKGHGRTLILVNKGGADGYFRITTSHPALIYLANNRNPSGQEVTEYVDTIRVGQQINVVVNFRRSQFKGQQAGDVLDFDITVESSRDGVQYRQTDADRDTLNIVHNYPVIEASPTILQLGDIIQGSTVKQQHTIQLSNVGSDTFDGYIYIDRDNNEWLRLDRSSRKFTLVQGATTSITITVNSKIAELHTQSYRIEDVLQFVRNNTKTSAGKFGVEFNISRAEALPYVHTRLLWLHGIEVKAEHADGQQHISLLAAPPEFEIEIGNYGSAAWRARVDHIAPWLDFDFAVGKTIEIPAQRVAVIKGKVNSRITRVGLAPQRIPEAITLTSVSTAPTLPQVSIPAFVSLSEAKPIIELADGSSSLFAGKVTSGQKADLYCEFQLVNTGEVTWQPSQAQDSRDEFVLDGDFAALSPHEVSTRYIASWNQKRAERHEQRVNISTLLEIVDDQMNGIRIPITYEIHPPDIEVTPTTDQVLVLYANQNHPENPASSPNSGGNNIFVNMPWVKGNEPQHQNTILSIINHGETPFIVSVEEVDPLTYEIISEGNLKLPVWVVLEGEQGNQFEISPGGRKDFRLTIEPTYINATITEDISLGLPDGTEYVWTAKYTASNS